jgi:hypothetical protein
MPSRLSRKKQEPTLGYSDYTAELKDEQSPEPTPSSTLLETPLRGARRGGFLVAHEVTEQLGHSDPRITLRIYARAMRQDLRP